MPDFAYFCGTEQFQPEVLLEHAVQAEAIGFDALAVSDHFHPWDIVTVQVTSLDQDATIKLLGKEVLPALRRLASPA